MKIVSWNLNGLMGTLRSSPFDQHALLDPDVICLQEIRTDREPVVLPGYRHFWNHGDKSGYSGTLLMSRREPLGVTFGFPGGGSRDTEGRVITAELEGAFVVDVYVPNARKGKSDGLRRQAYRRQWDAALLDYAASLMEEKPVILCGDFNVIRGDLDFFEENMRLYWATRGYASDEQSGLEALLDLGLVDAFRALHPNERSYTWWSNRLQKRSEDRGWRLDYFLVSEQIMGRVNSVRHLRDVRGSDHCPIFLEATL